MSSAQSSMNGSPDQTMASDFFSQTVGSLPRKISQVADEFDFAPKDYSDEDSISMLVEDTAQATKRGLDKAAEWLDKLHKQDVMTVGDLRDLQEEDWANLYSFFCFLILLEA